MFLESGFTGDVKRCKTPSHCFVNPWKLKEAQLQELRAKVQKIRE